MTTTLARGVPFGEAREVAKAHPGSVLRRVGDAFDVGYLARRDARADRLPQADAATTLPNPLPLSHRRPTPPTGLPSPPAHYAANMPGPTARPTTPTATTCPHGLSPRLCDRCWEQSK